MQQVVMFGLGYIGLPTAALMSNRNIQVRGVDVKQEVVDTINKGSIHIVEPGLEDLVKKGVDAGALNASLEPCEAEVFLIAVPTPFKGNYEPDLAYVESAIRKMLPVLKDGDLVIIESTSPVGTTETMQAIINDERPELANKIHMAYCPERVLPGNVIFELENNDRVIGGIDEASSKKAVAFYKQFVNGELHETNARTAEMCKLIENASRDSQIAFANELSMICEKAKIDVYELIELTNKHPRVNILQPGTGVGGHCIAVDPWFVVNAYPEQAQFIKQAREINNYKTDWVIERIKNAALQFELDNGRKARVAAMGLAFKPNIDDLRESPAVKVAEELAAEGRFELNIVEPNVDSHAKFDIVSMESALENSDIIALLVAHDEFKAVDYSGMQVLDYCGVLFQQKNVKELI